MLYKLFDLCTLYKIIQIKMHKLFNPFPTALLFMHIILSFESPVGKGEIAPNEQFLLFPQRFLPIYPLPQNDAFWCTKDI